jgi:hypothetical protein
VETITAERCRRIVAGLTGEPFLTEWEFSGCGFYDRGVRCGREEVERLVPIHGDHEGDAFSTPICAVHLGVWLGDHLLSGK